MTLVRLQQRRDTAANWTATNPVLASGEIGYDSTTATSRIGDGVTPWNSLSIQLISDASGNARFSGTLTALGTAVLQDFTATLGTFSDIVTVVVAGKKAIINALAIASGALVSGGWISGQTQGLNITPNNDGVSGKKLVLGYFDGSIYRSALEYASTTGSAITSMLISAALTLANTVTFSAAVTINHDVTMSNSHTLDITGTTIVGLKDTSIGGTAPATVGTITPTSLTTVGAAAHTGFFYKIGRLVFFTVRLTAATSTASTAGTTSFVTVNLPVPEAAVNGGEGTCQAIDLNSLASLGNGLVTISGGVATVFTPTWSARAGVIITGCYVAAA